MNSHKSKKIIQELIKNISLTPLEARRFFKTDSGEYGAHDQFLGVKVPVIRNLSKSYLDLNFEELEELINSNFNEVRYFCLIILIKRYQTGSLETKETVFQFYIKHLNQINNWNLIDLSCHHIIGAHLYEKDRGLIFELARSKNLWERRIAIVSNWFFIKKGDLSDIYGIARLLITDQEDLIQKALGWMLREAGKKDFNRLCYFLKEHLSQLKRTTLRYAMEKFNKETRNSFLK